MSLLLGRAQSLAFLGVGLLNPGLPRTFGLTWSRTRGARRLSLSSYVRVSTYLCYGNKGADKKKRPGICLQHNT